MDIHYYLLINGQAKGGYGAQAAKKIMQQLQKRKLAYTIYYTEYAGHESVLTEELALTTLKPWTANQKEKAFPLLVVLGGDGTLHNVLNTLDRFDPTIPLGYLPCGSGNDFARGAGISGNVNQALAQLLSVEAPKELQVIHYREANQEEVGLAANNLGIGLDAAIVEKTNTSRSKNTLNKFNLGSFSYLFSILHVLFKQKGFPILVEANGKQHTFSKAFLCTVTNHPYFGGGVAILPKADPMKPVVDLVVVERGSLFRIFWLILLLARGKHTAAKQFHHFHSKKIRIVSTLPQFIHADGEILGQRSVDFAFETTPRFFWF
ncbi:diacylglycerol/lipid kinase family protein [Enterococcus faecalis]